MNSSFGKVRSVNVSVKKGVSKTPAMEVRLIQGLGVEGDAHAAGGNRQVSLLAWESIEKCGLAAGDFAENITMEGIPAVSLVLGALLQIGDAVLKISKIGKECHTKCNIYIKVGDCIMPREGIFAEVVKGGIVRAGELITYSPPL